MRTTRDSVYGNSAAALPWAPGVGVPMSEGTPDCMESNRVGDSRVVRGYHCVDKLVLCETSVPRVFPTQMTDTLPLHTAQNQSWSDDTGDDGRRYGQANFINRIKNPLRPIPHT